MALSRLDLGGPLGDYLDGIAAVPERLRALYDEMADHPRANMMTHPELGAALEILVRAAGGRAVLEVGTFVGTSAGWMAGGLAEGGRIDTLEVDDEHADRAVAFLRDAGLADRVRVHRGPAAETLERLPDGTYDLCYIDADKGGYAGYLDHAARLVRPGGLILADNVLWSGRVALPAEERDEQADVLREFTVTALDHPRLRTCVLPVGDGVTLSVVR